MGDFIGLEPKVAQSRELAACTTDGVGGHRRCGGRCGLECCFAEMHTAVRPTSFELMRTRKITSHVIIKSVFFVEVFFKCNR